VLVGVNVIETVDVGVIVTVLVGVGNIPPFNGGNSSAILLFTKKSAILIYI
jgi:hypothetical protein